jgi:hypothetical protein
MGLGAAAFYGPQKDVSPADRQHESQLTTQDFDADTGTGSTYCPTTSANPVDNTTVSPIGSNTGNPPSFGEEVYVSLIGDSAYEPDLIQVSNGTIFVLGPGCLWASANNGASFSQWNISYPLGPALVDGDAHATSEPAGGVYFADLGSNNVSVGYFSPSATLQTWGVNQTAASGENFDRPWLVNDSSYVYLVSRAWLLDHNGHSIPTTDSIRVQRATFPGTGPAPLSLNSNPPIFDNSTFNLTQRNISATLVDIGRPAASSSIVVVPYSIDYGVSSGHHYAIVASLSFDHGSTWQLTNITSSTSSIGNVTWIFPEAAIDKGGNVYVAWANTTDPAQTTTVYLSELVAGTTSWSTPIAISNTTTALYPALVAGANDTVGVAFYGVNVSGDPNTFHNNSQSGNPATWFLYYAFSQQASAGNFSVVMVDPSPVHYGAMCPSGAACSDGVSPNNREFGDYFGLVTLTNGGAAIAYCDDTVHPSIDLPYDTECPIRFVQQIDGARLR